MGSNIREIKGRIKAVKNIQRITKTMQMIATARFQAMQKKATEAKAYTRRVGEVVGEVALALADTGQGGAHPLLTTPVQKTGKAAGRHLVLIITSNRGLCGGYNGRVLTLAKNLIKELPGQVEVEVVGRKGLGWCKFNKVEVAKGHTELGDAPKYADVAAIAQGYIEGFEASRYDSIRVVYAKFETMSRQPATALQLLPLQPPKAPAVTGAAAVAKADYEFSPDPASLLAELLPVTVKSTLFQCFNESVVSEQLARMVAMKSATDAAKKMGKSLKREFNRARQAAITTELSEIIGGAAALE